MVPERVLREDQSPAGTQVDLHCSIPLTNFYNVCCCKICEEFTWFALVSKRLEHLLRKER